LAIGVTGHRFLCQPDALIPCIDSVLARVEATWPGRALTVLSALAEGSDQLVVQRVLARPSAKLIVPLPLPEEEYMTDFLLPGSRQEFRRLLACADEIVRLPPAPTRPAAYEQSGQYVVDHCDIIIALWDGQPARGRGGTGAVVSNARQLRLPIAWIYTYIHQSDYTHQPPIKPQGAVSFENF
jgi:hypothetical protein